MVCVRAKENEDFNRLLRRFRRKVENAGIMKEVRRRTHYLKPSDRRKVKRLAAAKRRRRSQKRKS